MPVKGCVAGAGIKVTPTHWESYVSVQDSGMTFSLGKRVSLMLSGKNSKNELEGDSPSLSLERKNRIRFGTRIG